MNISLSLFMFCSLLLMSGTKGYAQHTGGDFGRYQVILDQQLLGRPAPPPPAARPDTPAPAPTPSWAVDYRLTMITEDLSTGSARAGLFDVRNQVGFLLLEGEETEGFRLHAVNFQNNRAEVSFQGNRHLFSLESAPAAAPVPEARPAPRPQSGPSPRAIRRVPSPPADEQRPPEPAEPRFSSPEELQAHLQNVQMDAIRTGKPPLPIPLTPEMDAQLVQEGVLPPLED